MDTRGARGHCQFCLPEFAHVWLPRASEVHQRNFWIEQHVADSSNLSLCLMKLFSFSNPGGHCFAVWGRTVRYECSISCVRGFFIRAACDQNTAASQSVTQRTCCPPMHERRTALENTEDVCMITQTDEIPLCSLIVSHASRSCSAELSPQEHEAAQPKTVHDAGHKLSTEIRLARTAGMVSLAWSRHTLKLSIWCSTASKPRRCKAKTREIVLTSSSGKHPSTTDFHAMPDETRELTAVALAVLHEFAATKQERKQSNSGREIQSGAVALAVVGAAG